MPTIGGIEMLVIAVVAIVVVGPKDLPKLMRGVGSFVSRVRAMASEFQESVNDLAREAELEDLRREMADLRAKNIVTETRREIEDAVSPVTGETVPKAQAQAQEKAPGPSLSDAARDPAPSGDPGPSGDHGPFDPPSRLAGTAEAGTSKEAAKG